MALSNDSMANLTEDQISKRLFIWSGKIKLLGSLDSDILEIILNFLVADARTSWIYGTAAFKIRRVGAIRYYPIKKNNYLYTIWKNMSEIETKKKQYNNLKKQQKNYLKNQQQKIRYQLKTTSQRK